MLRIIRCSAVVLFVAAPAALAAQEFEGRVTAAIHGAPNRPPADVVIFVKSGKSRMETDMGGMSMAMIMDYTGGTITMLMPQQKMYNKKSLKEAEAMMRGMTGGAAAPELPSIKRTGKRETIAGVSCEHVVFETKDGGQTDVCTASGMGFFGGGGGRSAGIPAAAEQLRKDFKDGFFPLKIESVEGTNRITRLEVKTVQKQAVDASLFEVPADYTEMTMPGMPGRP